MRLRKILFSFFALLFLGLEKLRRGHFLKVGGSVVWFFLISAVHARIDRIEQLFPCARNFFPVLVESTFSFTYPQNTPPNTPFVDCGAHPLPPLMVSKAERLAAWRAKQAAAKSAPTISSTADKPKAPVKISLSLKTKVKKDKNKDNKQSKKQANKSSKRRGGELSNNFGHSDSSEDEENGDSSKHKRFRPLLTVDELPLNDRTTSQHSPEDARTTAERNKNAVDDLDSFMESLEAGVDHGVHQEELNLVEPLSGKSTVGLNQHGTFLSSKKTITLEDLQKAGIGGGADVNESSRYTPNDWESDAASEASSVNDVEEEKARQEFMAALKREQEGLVEAASASTQVLQTTKEVASEKQRIANRRVQIELESAMATQKRIEQDRVETGRIYNDEGDVMEEAERVEDIMRLTNEGDVTRKIGELNKKKEVREKKRIDFHIGLVAEREHHFIFASHLHLTSHSFRLAQKLQFGSSRQWTTIASITCQSRKIYLLSHRASPN